MREVDTWFTGVDTGIEMQSNGQGQRPDGSLRLSDLREGEEAIIDRLDLADEVSSRLMELGFLPGTTVGAGSSAPGGDPRVFRVDGSEVALRRETSLKVWLRKKEGLCERL